MSKVNPADAPSQPDRADNASNTVQIKGDPADRSKLVAQCAVAPSLQAASTIQRWSKALGELDISQLIEELRQQAATASSGDLKRQEAMLTIQAHTLDTLFNELARRSAANVGEYMGAAEVYMRLALKAQSQCRTTIETLAEIKNPKPVAFVRQAFEWSAASEQSEFRDQYAHGRGRAGKCFCAEQTIGANLWRTVGVWSEGLGSRSRYAVGSRGSGQQGRKRPKVSGAWPVTPIGAECVPSFATLHDY